MSVTLPEAVDLSLNWVYAFGVPTVSADYRCEPEDFQVDEDLGYEPSGEGEHVYLHVWKRGNNTNWVVKLLARLADVQPMDVGYCGLKDRHAVTTQWFSVYLPKGEEPNWRDIEDDTIKVLRVTRHNRKLRRGSHRINRFKLVLRHLSGELDGLPDRLQQVAKGVPNYFGDQRFGIDAQNLVKAHQLLVEKQKIKNRQTKSLVMSSARSYLFNRVLSRRVANESWLQPLAGDVMDDGLPTGPLWGRGRLASQDVALGLESEIVAELQEWCEPLEHTGLTQERRKLLLLPEGFESKLSGDQLTLSFALPPGCFATAVLRELCEITDVSAGASSRSG